VDPALFPNAAAVNSAIQDVVALLRVPRASLGLACSSRGAVAGLVHVRQGSGGAWIDCARQGMAGWAIPGELAAVERLSFR
jgi:DNA topoisomerase VI subunit A